MKNVIRKTLPLVLLAACELPKGEQEQAAAARASAGSGYCLEPARYNLNCTQPTKSADGYMNTFCDAGLDINDPALGALRDSLEADIGDPNFYVRKGAFRASVLGYTDTEMSEFPTWESGVLTNGTQYVGITITSYGNDGLAVGGCE